MSQGSIQLKTVALRVFLGASALLHTNKHINKTAFLPCAMVAQSGASVSVACGARGQMASKMSSGEDLQMEQEEARNRRTSTCSSIHKVVTGNKTEVGHLPGGSFERRFGPGRVQRLGASWTPAVAAGPRSVWRKRRDKQITEAQCCRMARFVLFFSKTPKLSCFMDDDAQRWHGPPTTAAPNQPHFVEQFQPPERTDRNSSKVWLSGMLLTQSTTSANDAQQPARRPVGSFHNKKGGVCEEWEVQCHHVTQMGGHGTMPQGTCRPMGHDMAASPNVVGGSAGPAHQLTGTTTANSFPASSANGGLQPLLLRRITANRWQRVRKPVHPMVSPGQEQAVRTWTHTQQQFENMYSVTGQRLNRPGAMPPQTSSNGGMRQQQPVQFFNSRRWSVFKWCHCQRQTNNNNTSNSPPQQPRVSMIMLASGGNAPTPPGRPVMDWPTRASMGAHPPPFDTANASAAPSVQPPSNRTNSSGVCFM
ncbi:hypothetical protein niasHS_017062 [Heterodera schachtii]|uniref:Uncharacterized protein n=1 Tax=Heterodera schachtii TaxID=97005 RepID=A0ABD2HZF8_HETSC